MTHEVESQCIEKMQFNKVINSQTILINAPERVVGDNNRLLSYCNGIDEVDLFKKY